MELSEFFAEHRRAALGFSGGTDSAFLLASAVKEGADIQPYFVKSAFQPEFELEDAKRLCGELDVKLKIINLDVLSCPEISCNSVERCYYCKKHIFTALAEQALQDGYHTVIDGTNASDDAGDRPGMRAIRELNVLSPLRLCGIDKSRVRALSEKLGLFTWNKPSYACLATRIKTGEKICIETLRAVEKSEDYLRSLGFSDLRVRTQKGRAKVQLPKAELSRGFELEDKIQAELGRYFNSVTVDPCGR